jgi:hypothetical protein
MLCRRLEPLHQPPCPPSWLRLVQKFQRSLTKIQNGTSVFNWSDQYSYKSVAQARPAASVGRNEKSRPPLSARDSWWSQRGSNPRPQYSQSTDIPLKEVLQGQSNVRSVVDHMLTTPSKQKPPGHVTRRNY